MKLYLKTPAPPNDVLMLICGESQIKQIISRVLEARVSPRRAPIETVKAVLVWLCESYHGSWR